jgi:hypothetical protein
VLQLPVFLLQLPQSPCLAHFHPAVLRLPAVQAPAGDPVPPAQLVEGLSPPPPPYRMAMICSSLKRLLRTTPP